MPVDDELGEAAGLPGTSLTRLPRAAVLAAQDARLPASLLGDYLPALASAAQTGRRLTVAELARFSELGQAAAESGAALRALVDLYLSATWRAWPSLPATEQAAAPQHQTGDDPADWGTRDPGGPARPMPPRSARSRRRAGPEAPGAAERTRAAAAAVLRASDDAVAAVCEGYEAARTARARAEESLRRELVDDLLTGTATDPGLVLERAFAFGLRLEAPHLVLVAAGDRRFVDGRGTSRAVDTALGVICATPPLVVAKGGLLVCVVPQEAERDAATGDAATGDAADLGASVDRAAGPGGPGLARSAGDGPAARFAPLPAGGAGAASGAPRAVAALTAALGNVPGWRVGVSRVRTGVTGVRIGFAEASSAVELAGRLGVAGQAVHTDDLLIYKVLLRDREPLSELVETVLGPLRAARGGPGPLLETLDAYFATGAVALATARRLHLSVRALTYRLARIHQLTHHDPTAPADRYVLQTAVIGARLLSWSGAE
ncbi:MULTISPECIES: PucR family transcriptional regulator [Pseudofrankia]|uniref:PucR family transcriptional regulator n=1 Tax=Pseudofrankia TaxID=2994363 RepID=UPI000480E419|nr:MULTISPECIES: helix-turn-helix domain-containing protein [Pseudofrankia]OHV36447.1 PucR family transcriptional regulator [Pseudofrankia sp. EUN1h]